MIIGVLSDTHNCDTDVIRQIVADLKSRGAEILVHCGDIEPEHLEAALFGDLPVVCALTKLQQFDSRYTFSPNGWCFTKPGSIANRIVNLGPVKIYVGHERSFDALTDPVKVTKFIQEIYQICDGVRLIFSGHIHYQFLIEQGNMLWINPGSVTDDGGDGRAFALVDTNKGEVILSRIPLTPTNTISSTVGIIVDTGNVSDRDQWFWKQLAREFVERDARTLILVGNHWVGDIGRPEFEEFEVYYRLLPSQEKPDLVPVNWHLIPDARPVVDICGHRFLVNYELGVALAELSEYQALQTVKRLLTEYHQIDFLVCGVSAGALFEEGGEITILNPGNARNGRKFATVCLPRGEVTFGRVRLGD